MNKARIAIAVLVIAALVIAGGFYVKQEITKQLHRPSRQLVVYYTLSRLDQPIVILGDSITEASTLPRTLCGHPVVNAGLNGAATSSDLGGWLIDALDGKRAAAILIALGTNDALLGRTAQAFETSYTSLLGELSKTTDHLAVLGIPAVEVRGNLKAEFQQETTGRIDAFNAMLPALASKNGATFAALPAMPAPHTIDGVHLDAAGYAVWDAAVLAGVSVVCSKP